MKNVRYKLLLDDLEDDTGEYTRCQMSSIQSALIGFVFIFGFVVYIIFITTIQSQPIQREFEERLKPKRIRNLNISKFQDYYFTKEESEFLNCNEMLKGNKTVIEMYVNNGRMTLDRETLFELPMDCTSIKTRIYGDMPPFKPLKRSIAFVRTIYTFYELQEVFLSFSFHPDNIFCYILDSKSTDRLKTSIRQMSSCFPNVVVLDKEYNFNSGGHGQDPAHFDCLEKILDRQWDHVLILQNYDLIVKSSQQLSDLSETLNYTSITGFQYGNEDRFNTKLDWSPAGLNLFQNETGVPDKILYTGLKVRKSWNEMILSKIVVKSMFEKLNMQNILKRFDDNEYYGVDEMMVPTLYANYLGLDGQMTSNCKEKYQDNLTRWSDWNSSGSDGWNKNCKSNWRRHKICILGVEYLQILAETRVVIANKVMSSFDFGTIICTREMIKHNLTGLTPDANFLGSFPPFREMQLKNNGTYDATKFDC